MTTSPRPCSTRTRPGRSHHDLSVPSCVSALVGCSSNDGTYELQVFATGVRLTFQHQARATCSATSARGTSCASHGQPAVEAGYPVDGLDVIDGRPLTTGTSVVSHSAWGYVDIDGWRISASKSRPGFRAC